MQVAFVGTGKMGEPMVRQLLGVGHQVVVCNRSSSSTDRLAAAGALVADSPAAAASGAEVVATALPTPSSVEEVYAELAGVAQPEQIFVDHSTVSPDLNRRCAAAVASGGSAFLDAPMSGGPAGAEAGTLTLMVGGAESDLRRVRPVFEAFAANITLCGPIGAGQVVKLLNQLLVGVHTAAVAEAAVLGSKLGADATTVLEVLGTSFGGSTMMRRNIPRFVQRDFSGATPIGLILKDLGLIQREALAAGVPLPLGALTQQFFVEAVGRGLGNDDMAALVRLWEDPAGTVVTGSPAQD
jgi:3-hydroxyisobutyrate dehydrogenase-like beta-hydroxyacid dehydrogenase